MATQIAGEYGVIEPQLRLTFTYDQGREMSRHREFTKRRVVRTYFADPHGPWQRGSIENPGGLIREYLPKDVLNKSSF